MGRVLAPLPLVLTALSMALASCQAPMPTTPTGATPTPAPGNQPSAPATAAPTAEPTGAPTTQAPNQPVETTTLRGKVFDAAAKSAPDGTEVTVKSLDPTAPFETKVVTASGNYVVNGVPVGKQIEISATRDGWTRRTRIEVMESNTLNLDRRNWVNFGGTVDDRDPSGASYFISDYPEIERVEPVDNEGSVPHDKLSFRLVLSEPLDATNQGRLASAFMLIPNNLEALAESGALPDETATSGELNDLRAGADPVASTSYRFRQNSSYLNGFTISNFSWDADNRTATFSLDAPVKTDDEREAEYAFLLVHQDDKVIEDARGLPLGQDANGQFGDYVRGQIIRNAIRETEVALERVNGDPEDRWADTHLSYTTFGVAADKTAPTVTGVVARRGFSDGTGTYDRVEITFSEPMIAYPEIQSGQLLSLNNYILTAAPTQAEVDARTLAADGKANDVANGSVYTQVREAIAAANGATLGSNGATMDGGFSIAMSVKDPKVVVLQLPAGSLPLDANFIKVYAGSDTGAVAAASKPITDPAGNAVAEGGRQATGRVQ